MKRKLIAVLLFAVVAGAIAFGVHRYLYPNVIHNMLVCGQVLKNGEPVANQKAEIFAWFGGQRYLLEGESLTDSGREDRGRFKQPLSLDASGKFCLDNSGLKYFYKLGQFKIFAMQFSPSPKGPQPILDPYSKKPPPMPSAAAIEGVIVSGELDQKAQQLKLEVVFELEGESKAKVVETVSDDFKTLFNNEERFKPQ